MSMFYNVKEVAEMCGVGQSKAYRIIKELNQQLERSGYIVIAGKIPKKYFLERCYGSARSDDG